MKLWKTITLECLKTYLFAPQLNALIDYASIPGGPDIIPMIIEDTISRIRAEVHGKVKNALDDDHLTLPPEVRSAAMHLILEAIQSRVPGISLSDEQKENAKQARELLRRISKGEVPVTYPSPFEEDTSAYDGFFPKHPPVDVLSKRALVFSRNHFRGL